MKKRSSNKKNDRKKDGKGKKRPDKKSKKVDKKSDKKVDKKAIKKEKKADKKGKKAGKKVDKKAIKKDKKEKKAGKAKRVSTTFLARVEMDPTLHTPVVVLESVGPDCPGGSLQARIAPEFGSNLFSLQVGGRELMFGSEDRDVLRGSGGGTPLLFPTPGRVRDAHFTFGGRRFDFEPNKGANYIHGMARNTSFYFNPPRVTSNAAVVETWFDWDERQPDFHRFPVRHRLQVDFRLSKTGVQFAMRVTNADIVALPFGFGLHPWFRVPGQKENILIGVPAEYRMEAMDLMPTGKLVPVTGTAYDLRVPRSLAGMELDDVYFGVKPTRQPPTIDWQDLGIRLQLFASREFGHAVVFTPDRPVFCVENQTTSADAHNLHESGKRRESGLIVVAPGKEHSGTVDWSVSSEPTPPAA